MKKKETHLIQRQFDRSNFSNTSNRQQERCQPRGHVHGAIGRAHMGRQNLKIQVNSSAEQ